MLGGGGHVGPWWGGEGRVGLSAKREIRDARGGLATVLRDHCRKYSRPHVI